MRVRQSRACREPFGWLTATLARAATRARAGTRARGAARARAGTVLTASLALAATLALTACGSPGSGPASGTASPSANSAKDDAGAYLNCLLQHRGGGAGSARQACGSLRPADLAAALLTFENCLKAHGVTGPALPAHGRRAALVQFVSGLQDGSAAQRSALAACEPPGLSG